MAGPNPLPVPWRAAWQAALYGPTGFYRQPVGPAGHFQTATHGVAGAVLAEAIWRLAEGYGLEAVVDVGAGRGELLQHLYASGRGRSVAGLDVVARPDSLLAAVGWTQSPGGASLPTGWGSSGAFVVAHEWLDVVPCVVGEVDADGVLREVCVDAAGSESLGEPLDGADLAWCQRYWPSVVTSDAEVGDRVEVGRTRDDAWSALLGQMDGGAALAVDYGHTFVERPRYGTLSSFRSGRQVAAVPDGSRDITAHVAVDSLRHCWVRRQRDMIPAAESVDLDLARTDPPEYLRQLARSSEVADLRRQNGFGDFWWVFAEPARDTSTGADEEPLVPAEHEGRPANRLDDLDLAEP